MVMFLSFLKQLAFCVSSQKRVMLIYSWLSVIGLFIVFRSLPLLILLLKVFLAMTGMALGMYFYNDICDFEQDMAGRELGDFSPRPVVP